MTRKANEKPDFFAGVMQAAAAHGWHRATLADIAAATGLTLTELHERFGSKGAILGAFVDHIDRQVLAEGAAGDDGEMVEVSARDRLFDVMMRRFDALQPYRDGIAAITRDMPAAGPVALLCGAGRTLRSMAWMLEAAGIGSAGFRGKLRAKGLAAVYAATFGPWLRDRSEDMADTMAALDKNLARAERVAGFLDGSRRWGRSGTPGPEEGGPEGDGPTPAGATTQA